MTIYLCQKCRTVMDTECKELKNWHHVSDAWKCTGCGQHIDCHNEIHLHHLQEAFDAVKIVREQTKEAERKAAEPDPLKWLQVPQKEGEPRMFRCRLCKSRRPWDNLGHLCFKSQAEATIHELNQQELELEAINTQGRDIKRKQASGVEAYLRLYLELTGKKIEDVELCMRTSFHDMNITVEHWLEAKK